MQSWKTKILNERNRLNVEFNRLYFQDLHKTVRLFDEDSEFLKYIWNNLENFKTRKRK